MSERFECLTPERWRLLVDLEQNDEQEALQREAERLFTGKLADMIHIAAEVAALRAEQNNTCDRCVILLNGLIWGIRLERKYNEERALELLAGSDV